MFVAITGGIGCGKTTVLNEFKKMGIPCFMADEVGGAYYLDPSFLKQVRALFGNQVFLADGSVNKRAIADIVFHDSDALARLNALVHPRVWDDFLLFAQHNSDKPYVIFESAIVYEYGFDLRMNSVVGVYLEKEERIRRLVIRDNASRDQILARVNNQHAAEDILGRADYVVLNYEGNPRSRQVAYIHNQLLNIAVH